MKKLLIYLLLLADFIVTIGFWWQFSGNLFTGGDLNSAFLAISRLAGLLATQMALLQLILIGRVKWVEGQFGLDKLSRIHKWNGYAILLLIIVHVVLITKAYAFFNQFGFIEQFTNSITGNDDIFKAFLAVIVLFITVFLSITIVRRNLKYESWYYVHIFNYAAFALFVLHQFTIGTSAQNESFKIFWFCTYAFAGLHILFYRFFLPIWRFYKYDYTISKVEDLGVATSVYISGKNLARLKRQSGQFFIFRFLQKGFWLQAHPFSLSWGATNSQIRLTAKKLGDFTTEMPKLQIGTKVIIDGPHGVFTSQKVTKQKVLLIAGGIGITPLRSLAEELAGNTDLTLIYSAKTKADAVLLDELLEIQSKRKFRLIQIYDAEQVAGAEFGRLDKSKLQTLVPNVSEYDVFLCGPPGMMSALKTSLTELGLPNKQLHWERFAL
jgi:predicted ferric reductase